VRPATRFIPLLIGVVLVGCAAPGAPPSPAAPAPPAAAAGLAGQAPFPVTVVDGAGRQVTLARAPARIVSVAPSATEILYALGLGEQIVAVDQHSNFPPEAAAKATLGPYARPDLEAIVAAAPDLILATGAHLKTIAPALEERRLTVLVLEPKTLPEVLDSIRLVGEVTGRREAASRLVEELRERGDAVTARVAGRARPRVYVELSPKLHSAGPGSFLDDLLRRAGGENVAAGAAAPWPQLSQEALLLSDPQVVLLVYVGDVETPETIRARPGWAGVSAVREGRVVVVDPDLTTRAGPRVAEALETLARALHPDAFAGKAHP
jgi:iron complex transport system substrate-binding protein